MELDISPRHSPGGTLHLLSHAHGSPVDGFNAIRQIRRSLSRSPSKPSRYSCFSHLNGGASVTTAPRSPSGLSRAHHADPTWEARITNSPHRAGLGRSTRSRRGSPNSPLRRALSDNTNQANALPRMATRRSSSDDDQENMDCSDDTCKSIFLDEPIKADVSRPAVDRFLQPVRRELASPMKSSPLKRSDGVMNLEASRLGSPRSSKRRSLHSPSSTDFNVFDQSFDGALQTDGAGSMDDATKESASGVASIMLTPSSPHRRPFSLRKSTLQQRAGPGRRISMLDTTRDIASTPSASSRTRARFSLDGSLPLRSAESDSPFRKSTTAAPVGLFSTQSQFPVQATPKPHPLSNALTPSSTTSSVGESHPPTTQLCNAPLDRNTSTKQPPIARPTFSKSLPIGAMRPPQPPSQESFATPVAFKDAKPLPQAFMSTGLISKRNRNVELPPSALFASVNMPDTPSKKAPPVHISDTPSTSNFLKVSQPMHEFGSPGTPFHGRRTLGVSEQYPRGLSIFGAKIDTHHSRSASFVSTDGEEMSNSPSKALGSQSFADDLPPTPTKSTSSANGPLVKGKSSSLRSSIFGRRSTMLPETFSAPSREQSPSMGDEPDDECKSEIPCPTADHTMKGTSTIPSLAFPESTTPGSRSRRSDSLLEPCDTRSPSPLARRSQRPLPDSEFCGNSHAKMSVFPASHPLARVDRSDNASPHTPQESFTPPDPSYLAISMEHRGSLFNSHSFPPATPTGPRTESFKVSVGGANASTSYFANDVDTSLTSRFGLVTSIGAGEFSQVYKVENAVPGRAASQTEVAQAGSVWAVKKSRRPYTGVRDRSRKMQEVQILQALRGQEHVVEYVDHWESKNHLYLQTEYCDNGNLKDFLLQTGFKGRLDDFRIWKILLELAQGVQAIHAADFIHLDLKPANVFIDWEGVLKIGDFGLASSWPAPAGLDGEGDREYIGPEVLSGHFDKPADIFSLGMILLEIAGNIVLPDNGTSWQRLRNGDLSDLPSLTSSSDCSLLRDDQGEVLDVSSSTPELVVSAVEDEDDDLAFLRPSRPPRSKISVITSTPSALTSSPPSFMTDPSHSESLDRVVQWLINPDPACRPAIGEVLGVGGVRWVDARRRAGATVYEGNWGPSMNVVPTSPRDDIEMLDF